MKVLRYSVRNVLKVSEVDLNMEGHNLVLVGGANGHGKSSTLTALLMALCGKSGMNWPDIPLKDGEKEGSVTVTLSGDEELHDMEGFTVELNLLRRRGGNVVDEVRVLDSSGEEAPEPRTLLKRLYSMKAFDPLAFEREKPSERKRMLQELLGLDFSDLDKERAEVYSTRTVINKEGVKAKAELDAIEIPQDCPDEPVSAADLFTQLESARAHNQKIDNYEDMLKATQELSAKLDSDIASLKERLAQAEERKQNAEAKILEVEAILSEAKKVSTDEIEEQIKSADEINAAVAAKTRRKELSKTVAELRNKSTSLTNRLKQIDDEKQERLENAKWPLPEMSLDESGVLLNGLPFEQASKAERVLASVRVGMALNPKLRLLVCEDGNDLDNDTLAALEEALKEGDFQMLLEFVTRNDADEERCAVVFKDGSPK